MIRVHTIKFQKAYMLTHLIDKYYDTDTAGGCVHIVLDDGNYGKKNAEWCYNDSKKENDYWGEVISKLLMEFNEEEQEQIIERPHEITMQIGT